MYDGKCLIQTNLTGKISCRHIKKTMSYKPAFNNLITAKHAHEMLLQGICNIRENLQDEEYF